MLGCIALPFCETLAAKRILGFALVATVGDVIDLFIHLNFQAKFIAINK